MGAKRDGFAYPPQLAVSFNYQEIPPPPPADRYVKCVWVMSGEGEPDSLPQPIVPDGCTELLFNFADRFTRHHPGNGRERQAERLVVGQMSQAVVVEPGRRIDLIGVRLHPWGARPLFGLPLPELQDRIEALELVPRGPMHALGEQLGDVNVERRAAVALDILADLARKRPEPDALAVRLVEDLKHRRGSLSVKQLASDIGRSTRYVQRLFGETMGIAPRDFLRIMRFHRALKMARSGTTKSWARVAAESGYFDQAHLVRDFHRLAGCSPTEFARTERSFADSFLTD